MQNQSIVDFVLTQKATFPGGLDVVNHVNMKPHGENANLTAPIGAEVRDYYLNYYLGHTMPNGVEQVGGYSTVTYPNYFQGIDLRFYGGSAGHKMSFYCQPGSNPQNNLYLRFGGHDSLKVDVDGTLKIYLNGQWLRLREAAVFQLDQNDNVVPLAWLAEWQKINDNVVSFVFDGYDPTRPLILQVGPPPLGGQGPVTPGICWGTYFGGNGADEGANLEVDGAGDIYMSGTTSSDWFSYPDLLGNYTNMPTTCAYLTKFDATYQRLWTLFLGGGTSTTCSGLAVQPSAAYDVYIAGWTSDAEFHYHPNNNGVAFEDPSISTSQRGFLAKFTTDGQIQWSTPFGAAETSITGMDFDNLGRLVVCGESESYLPPEFEALPPSYHHEPYHGGLYDGFVAMFNEFDQLMWRTHYGGSDQDDAIDVRCAANKIVLLLQTQSDDMPLHDGGINAHDEGHSGYLDAAIVEFNLTGVLNWATYFGGGDEDWVGAGSNGNSSDNAIDIDPVNGDIYLVGSTFSDDLPIEPGPGWYDDTPEPGCGWVAKFRGSDRSRYWVSYYGPAYTELLAIHVLPNSFLLAGDIHSAGGPAIQPSWVDWYLQPSINQDVVDEEQDARITEWRKATHSVVWSTYFGGNSGSSGDVIMAIATFGSDVLMSGLTSKYIDNLSFFPLTDPVGETDYFDVTYNDVQISDAYIVHFCPMPPVGLAEETGKLGTELDLFTLGEGVFEFTLRSGNRALFRVLDTQGRILFLGSHVAGTGRTRIDLSNCAAGVYALEVKGIGMLRLLVAH